jgi:hypothetical protein
MTQQSLRNGFSSWQLIMTILSAAAACAGTGALVANYIHSQDAMLQARIEELEKWRAAHDAEDKALGSEFRAFIQEHHKLKP